MPPASDAAVARPPESGDPGAVCHHHPGRRASITCPHCGSYACGECTVDTLWGDVMCEDCRRHGRAQYPLPWEHSLSPLSFLQTVYLLFAEAGPCFADLPRGRVLRAVGFAACVSLLLMVMSLLSEWVFPVGHWASDAPDLSRVLLRVVSAHVPSALIFVIVVSAAFHATATALGGRTSLATSLRAVCYLSVLQLLELVVRLVDTLLLVNTPVALIVRLVGLFFLVWSLSLVAQHRFRLARGRAIIASLAPIVVLLAAAVLLLSVFGVG